MIRTRFDPRTGQLPEDVPQCLDMREDTPGYTRPAEAEGLAVWRRRGELAAAVAAFDPLWDSRHRRPVVRPAPRGSLAGWGPPATSTAAEVA